MKEKEIEVNGKKIKIAIKLPKGYIEDNNLKVFLDDTMNLEEVVSEIKCIDFDNKADEINQND